VTLLDDDPVAWLVAHEQIRQLAARYAVALDARDLDTLVSLFVDDVQVSRDERGRDALRANFDAQLRPLGVTILHVANHVIDVLDADHARGIVSCHAEIQRDGHDVMQAIQYHDANGATTAGCSYAAATSCSTTATSGANCRSATTPGTRSTTSTSPRRAVLRLRCCR
jgi:ketosteroid isomerase-like protein